MNEIAETRDSHDGHMNEGELALPLASAATSARCLSVITREAFNSRAIRLISKLAHSAAIDAHRSALVKWPRSTPPLFPGIHCPLQFDDLLAQTHHFRTLRRSQRLVLRSPRNFDPATIITNPAPSACSPMFNSRTISAIVRPITRCAASTLYSVVDFLRFADMTTSFRSARRPSLIDVNISSGTSSFPRRPISTLVGFPPDAVSDAEITQRGQWLRQITSTDATVASLWAGAPIYYSQRSDLLGKSDSYIARKAPNDVADPSAWNYDFYPGQDKWDLAYSVLGQLPDIILNYLGTAADTDQLLAAGDRRYCLPDQYPSRSRDPKLVSRELVADCALAP